MATTKTLTHGDIGTIHFEGVHLEGTDSSDVLSGTFLADTINGNGGNDTLYGYGGNDVHNGGDGNDVLDGGAGADQLIGGNGFDTVTYADATAGVLIDLQTGTGTNDAAGDSYSSIEKFIGTAYGDIMNGDATDNNFDGGEGDNWLFGHGGNDVLRGGSGNDNIIGGDGNDVLWAGAGNNRLTGDGEGGRGFDTFVITAQKTGTTTITDFDLNTDTLSFSGFGNKPYGNDGKLAWGYLSEHDNTWVTYNLDGSDKLFYDVGTHQLVDMNANLAQAMLDHAAIGANAFHAEVIFSNDASLSLTNFQLADQVTITGVGGIQAGHGWALA